MPLAHPPGDAQADVGDALVVIAGVACKAHDLVVDLPHSDDGFVQAFPAETTEAVCDGHNAAFTSCRGRAEPWVVRARLLVDQALITLGLILRRGCGGLDRRLHLRARGTRPPAFEAVEGSSGRAMAIGASQPRVSPGCMIVTA